MPVDWPFAEDIIRLGGVGARRIEVEDGARQQETARSILRDFAVQPGVILGDEVGTGKTYVALAVIASVVRATRGSGRPVVVMMPPALAHKWRREWEQFKAVCCTDPHALAWIRAAYVHTPTDFFKLVDDARDRRPHIVWMTTSCFGRGLSDPWTKLALVRLARGRTRMDDETKKRIYKWATALVRLKRKHRFSPEVVERLLQSDLSRWHRILVREEIIAPEDGDPIPQHLLQHQHQIDWTPLVLVLRGESIPGRRGAVSKARLREARWDFNEACQQVYWDWLARVRWRAPLLILDEAHHAKNDDTRLASLLRSEETQRLVEGGASEDRPLLWERFDRMLFLTATPFQLGHHELIRVLRSFAAAKWSGVTAPAGMRDGFITAMVELERRLNETRSAGRRLDRLWGRLAPSAAIRHAGADHDMSEAAVTWWNTIRTNGSDDPIDRELLGAIEECRRTKVRAEIDDERPWCSVRPWLIRHNRPEHLPGHTDGRLVARRQLCPGRAIADDIGDDTAQPSTRAVVTGLPIAGERSLPFLLAARAQGELSQGSTTRAYFAEGLCSSYEAFHHTRENRGDARDIDDDGIARSSDEPRAEREESLVPVSWYEDQVERLIPSKRASEEERYAHPKINSVVARTVSLWLSGEKVLLFCFYRETAKALRQHIGREVEKATLGLAARKLGLDIERHQDRLRSWFERVARRLSDDESPFHRAIVAMLRESLERDEFKPLRPHLDVLVQLLAAYVRSPSFIARYLPLEVAEVREALSSGSARAQVVRGGAAALTHALIEHTDASAMSMRGRIDEFLRFATELADRPRQEVAEDDEDSHDPLKDYLDAIAVYVSPRRTSEDDDEQARSVGDGAYRVLQPVRMVYGDTRRDVRERLMLAFNSPMFPEILISSAVLGEGVDLHRFCRYVIHHDLCWNPSTLEQRTGRLDRIRCKAELTGRPIVVYEPFIGGSADEKMFRVVRDRERWFQVVMGQKFEFTEAAAEELANRVPLPIELAHELIFDLRRFRSSGVSIEAVVPPQAALVAESQTVSEVP